MSEASTPAPLVEGQRGQRYGEVLAIFAEEGRFFGHVYGTQLLNDCPPELWEALDVPAITEQLGVLFVKLNGPRHWVIDALGSEPKAVPCTLPS